LEPFLSQKLILKLCCAARLCSTGFKSPLGALKTEGSAYTCKLLKRLDLNFISVSLQKLISVALNNFKSGGKFIMNILLVTSKEYVWYATVMMKSLCETNRTEKTIYIFHCELDKDDMKLVKNAVEDEYTEIKFIYIKDSEIFEPWKKHSIINITTCFKLLAVDLLPKDLERILFLDIDMVVNGSLEELYNTDFENNYLAACYEILPAPDSKFNKSKINRVPGFQEEIPQFNAGVMLLNLEKLRNDGYGLKKFDEMARKFNYEFKLPEQDLLNYIFYRKTKILDGNKWNYQVNIFQLEFNKGNEDGVSDYQAKIFQLGFKKDEEDGISDVHKIIHFSSPAKPWAPRGLGKKVDKYVQIWLNNLEKLPSEIIFKCLLMFRKSFYIDAERQYIFERINLISSDDIMNYFKKNNIKKIILYGLGSIGKSFYYRIKDLEIECREFIDRDIKEDYENLKRVDISELKKNSGGGQL